MREVVIVEAVRTPIGRRNGKLKDVHPVVLGSLVLKEVVHRAGIKPEQVEDVIFGCVTQAGEQSLNIGRNAWLTAGFPFTTPATSVDRQCGSSQQAIHFASNLIQSGVCDITIAGGVESMTRVPMGANAVSPGTPFPPELMELYDLVPQGISAELMARKYGVSRKAMDEFSVESHQRAHEATEKGYLRRSCCRSTSRSTATAITTFSSATRESAPMRATRRPPRCSRHSTRNTRSPPATRARSRTARRRCF